MSRLNSTHQRIPIDKKTPSTEELITKAQAAEAKLKELQQMVIEAKREYALAVKAVRSKLGFIPSAPKEGFKYGHPVWVLHDYHVLKGILIKNTSDIYNVNAPEYWEVELVTTSNPVQSVIVPCNQLQYREIEEPGSAAAAASSLKRKVSQLTASPPSTILIKPTETPSLSQSSQLNGNSGF
jgi:hypothetical protein